MMNRLDKQRGLGLIETLIIMVVILGCAMSLISFQTNLSYSDDITQQQADATILAMSEIETLRDFDVLYTQSPYTAYQSIASGNTSSTVGFTTYTVTWTVASFVNPTYKTANVVVSWTDRRSVAQSITLDTIIAGIEPSYSASIM